MSFAQRKADEFLNMAKQKTTKELTDTRNSLLGRLKNERSKENPDESSIGSLNWQLSLLGRELASRKPAHEKEPMQAISDEQELEMGGESESTLESKTLDALNDMLKEAEKELSDLKDKMERSRMTAEGAKESNQRVTILKEKISSLTTEISGRSSKAQSEAKKDMWRAEGKWFGVEKDMILMGALAGVIGGAIGWGTGKSGWVLAGFAVIGAGVGAGGTYLVKRQASLKKISPAPYV